MVEITLEKKDFPLYVIISDRLQRKYSTWACFFMWLP